MVAVAPPPLYHASVSTAQSPVAHVTVTLGAVLKPVPVVPDPRGVLWSTPVKLSAAHSPCWPVPANVITTLLAPVAGATKPHISAISEVRFLIWPYRVSALPAYVTPET